MSPAQVETFRAELEAMTSRAVAAERRAGRAERERDQLRALLARTRTSLAEIVDDGQTPLRPAA